MTAEVKSSPQILQWKIIQEEGSDIVVDLPVSTDEKVNRVLQKFVAESGKRYVETRGDGIFLHAGLKRSLTLADLQTLETYPLRGKIIEHLNLQRAIDAIDARFPFFDRLKAVAEPILQQASLFDLESCGKITLSQNSPVYFALAPDELLCQLAIEDVTTLKEFPTALYLRLQQMQPSVKPVARPADLTDLPIDQISTLTAEEIEGHAETLSARVFRFLADSQIQTLDFSKLEGTQIAGILKGGLCTHETVKERFEMLSEAQREQVYQKVNDSVLQLLPDSYYRNLPLSQMSSEQRYTLFPVNLTESHKKHFALISSEEVAKSFPAISGFQDKLVSDEHIQATDWKQMAPRVFNSFFLYSGDDQTRRHRVSLLSPAVVLSVIDRVDSSIYRYLTDPQIEAVRAKMTAAKEFENLYLDMFDVEEKRRRVAMLSSGFINRFIGDLGGELMPLLTEQHIRDIDVAKLKQSHVDRLCPSFALETLYPGLTYRLEKSPRWGPIHNYTKIGGQGKTSMTDDVAQNKIAENRAACLRAFALLLQAKVEIIRPLLKPEVAALATQFFTG